jgi:hypothetical protein
VISSNANAGVLLWNGNNEVYGNLIGSDISGTSAPANGDYRVAAYGGSNQIGGAGDGQAGNVLSGNFLGGVMLRTGDGNRVQHNLIGTDIIGKVAIKNSWTGVVVDSGGNTIGGVGDEGNVISGNHRAGVSLYKPGNFVYGNLIGTDITGLTPPRKPGLGRVPGHQCHPAELDFRQCVAGHRFGAGRR